jgi:sigma-B regulation protein RsbU (phosphoserine phosphatase)
VPTLSITSGPDSGAQFKFDQSSVMTIGRGAAVGVALTDASVSRRHALVDWKDGAWGVSDLGSFNGTFVNGRRISQRVTLASGDALKIGSVLCTFTDAAPGTDTAARRATQVAAVQTETSDSEILLRVSAEAAAQASAGDHTIIGAARRSRLLDSLSKITAMMFDERGLLTFIVDELLQTMPLAQRVSVMMWDPDLSRFVPVATRARSGESGPVVASQTLLQDVITRKDAVLVANVLTDRNYAQAESMLALKMTSAVCAPILFQQDILGVIQVACTGSTPFTQADVTMTMALALQVGMALSYARLHAKLVERELVERDLQLARKIQQHFLPPKPPEPPGFGFAVEYTPALAVGGDLYDFVPLAGGSIAVAVGDVSGKGVSAALFAAKVMSDLRYQAAGQTSASEILRRVNQVIAAGNEESMFVTVSLAVIDPFAARLTVASAGHPLPLVRDASGAVTPVGSTGDMALGLDENARFREFRYEMDPGDGVVLYTDGVIEAMNKKNDLYGDDRLIAAIGKAPPGAAAVVRDITADVRAFAAGQTQSDDITVVCFARI